MKGIDAIAKAMIPRYGERAVVEAVKALGRKVADTARSNKYVVTWDRRAHYGRCRGEPATAHVPRAVR